MGENTLCNFLEIQGIYILPTFSLKDPGFTDPDPGSESQHVLSLLKSFFTVPSIKKWFVSIHQYSLKIRYGSGFRTHYFSTSKNEKEIYHGTTNSQLVNLYLAKRIPLVLLGSTWIRILTITIYRSGENPEKTAKFFCLSELSREVQSNIKALVFSYENAFIWSPVAERRFSHLVFVSQQ